MRKTPKYKLQFVCKTNLSEYSAKLLRFKKTKWSFVKNLEQKFKRYVFRNFFKISKNISFFEKSKKFYQLSLNYKRIIKNCFDNSIKLSKIKKNLQKKNHFGLKYILKKILIEYEYRLDILLYKLNIFDNIYKARSYIKKNGVILNNKKIYHLKFLKEGDVLNFEDIFYSLEENLKKKIKKIQFFPHLEIDYYTNYCVVIKDAISLSEEDLTLFFQHKFNISHLYNSIFKN